MPALFSTLSHFCFRGAHPLSMSSRTFARPGPVCGLAGRKDEACTHMSCPRCQTSWCYLCGLSVEMCDKKPPLPGRPAKDIFLHNADWEVNPARCPMYLTQILEVDPSWLGDWTEGDEVDDEQCLAYFHRWRTIKLLQEVQEEVGLSIFQQVWLLGVTCFFYNLIYIYICFFCS